MNDLAPGPMPSNSTSTKTNQTSNTSMKSSPTTILPNAMKTKTAPTKKVAPKKNGIQNSRNPNNKTRAPRKVKRTQKTTTTISNKINQAKF